MTPTHDSRQFLERLLHDLREPLRSVRAFSEILAERLKTSLSPEDEKILMHVLTGASRMDEVLEGVSSYTLALGDGGKGVASLQLAFDVVMSKLEDEAKALNATIVCKPLPRLNVGLERLIQLLENLLRNALKFRRDAPPEVRLSARLADAGNWLIRVEDNGIGIDPSDCEAVFAPFTRLNGRAYPGAGLGLTISRAIVENHGGRIWVESLRPNGCGICFTLPAGKS